MNTPLRAMPPPAASDEPTLGAIKSALHELCLGDGPRLREAHDLLRKLAVRAGVDPDEALQRRRDALNAHRERMSHLSHG